jgi:hypothetical protein
MEIVSVNPLAKPEKNMDPKQFLSQSPGKEFTNAVIARACGVSAKAMRRKLNALVAGGNGLSVRIEGTGPIKTKYYTLNSEKKTEPKAAAKPKALSKMKRAELLVELGITDEESKGATVKELRGRVKNERLTETNRPATLASSEPPERDKGTIDTDKKAIICHSQELLLGVLKSTLLLESTLAKRAGISKVAAAEALEVLAAVGVVEEKGGKWKLLPQFPPKPKAAKKAKPKAAKKAKPKAAKRRQPSRRR